jgi:flagellar M-ring protein FliF
MLGKTCLAVLDGPTSRGMGLSHVNGVTDIVKALGPARIAAMGAVAAILIGFFAFIMMRWSQPQMSPLFTEVALTDSAAIVRELDRLQVRYQLRDEGRVIMVPREDVARARMRLAEQNLPRGGHVGYEIFDRGETLGTTSFVQNLNHLRALEGELARSIASINGVQSARVHLVIPERQIFSRERQEPTASIVTRVRGGLETAQVRAIQHLVASAVPGMRPGNVSIVDETGRLLASGRGEAEALALSGIEERRIAQEERLRRDIEDTLARVVGPGRARVQVAVELDWNRVTQTQDMFDPEGRVQRSTQTRTERSNNQESRDRQVSVGNELPGANANRNQQNQNDPASREQTEKNEEVVNYEISRTQRQEVSEAGRLRRISVAVLVDGTYQRQGEQLAYQARPQEELDRLTALVRSAVGFNEQRGDRVEVVNLRFAAGPPVETLAPEPAPTSFFAFSRDEIFRMAELGVLVLLALLTLLVVIRPLLRKVLGDTAAPGTMAIENRMDPALPGGETAAIADLSGGADQAQALKESATERAMEVAALAGQMHNQSVQKISELVQQNPSEATVIIRSWMNESNPQPTPNAA